jgi:two-component system, OmpR family, sensor histidine kinase KdpD
MFDLAWPRLVGERPKLGQIICGAALVGLVSVIGKVAPPDVTEMHLALMYLFVVFIAAIRWGLWPALFTAALSVAVLDYLFLPPLYTFSVDTPQDYLLMALLSVVAIIASGLAARLREQVTIARQNAETTAALYRFAGRLAGTVTPDETIRTVLDQVAAMIPHRAAIFLKHEVPPAAALSLPLRSSGETVGTLTVNPESGAAITNEQRRLLEALAELAGIAIGRQVLADRLAQLGIEQAADRLRSALLNSIAHDLTAPIASVATALTSLTDHYESFAETTRRELIADAEREALHLHQFSANLVHIARLESGAVELRRLPTDMAELIDNVVNRARPALEPRRVVVDVPPDMPFPLIDPILIDQAIFHVLENAGKYTSPDSAVSIIVAALDNGITIEIADEGPGFPVEDGERIFAKFYRAPATSRIAGTGLGLAICRGFVEAHGGTITATNRSDRRGALFAIVLPLGDSAAAVSAPSMEPLA